MTPLEQLIDKLSSLCGPSRSKDILVGELLVPDPRLFNLTDRALRNGKPPCPLFTNSVDKVLELVPEGWALTLTQMADGSGKAILWKDSWEDSHKATMGVCGANPAIAGLIAIALHHQGLVKTDANAIPSSETMNEMRIRQPEVDSPWYYEENRTVDISLYKPKELIQFKGRVLDVQMAFPRYLMVEYSPEVIVSVAIEGDEFDDRVNEIMDYFDKDVEVHVEVRDDYTVKLRTVSISPE